MEIICDCGKHIPELEKKKNKFQGACKNCGLFISGYIIKIPKIKRRR